MLERVQQTLDRIPGYTAYRAKERRRDDDRAIREQFADDLDATAAQVETITRDLANQRRLDLIQPVESLFRQIGHLASRVRTAPAGYAGLFDEREIDELALDQLRRFDEQTIAESSTLAEQVTALQRAAAAKGDLAPLVAAVEEEVARIGAIWDGRMRVVESARPSPEREVVALLDPAQPSPTNDRPLTVNVGDALAILDENFIVTSMLRVDAAPHELLLARLDSGPTWLFLLQGQSTLAASVVQVEDGNEPAGSPLAAGQGRSQATDHTGATAEAAVAFALHAVGDDEAQQGTIWLRLDWGREQRQYSGKRLHMSDVEMFGRPTT